MIKKFSILTVILLVAFASLQAQNWTKIGADIDGEAENDESGNSVSLSADGSIVAIGAYKAEGYKGHVRVYQNQSGTWTQIGSDIVGEANYDYSGRSVSLSADGSIVAIGASENDGNGSNSGHVRVYQNQSGTWIQIGSDINGGAADDYFGRSVSLSADGSIVAIGATQDGGSGTWAGYVSVFQNISGTWTQVGSNIYSEATNNEFGWSVSLSASGSVVAIGAPLNSNANGSYSGHVRVYQNQRGIWTQIGTDIDGEAAGDMSGCSVSLNAAGSIVAIGALYNAGVGDDAGHVRVYQNISGTWTQIGSDIDAELAMDYSGFSVSLNDEGSIVAIGAIHNIGNNSSDAGQVRVYQNQSETWTQIGSDIDGEDSDNYFGYSVSLSADGSVVAGGATGNDGNGEDAGHVRVYGILPSISLQPISLTNICLGNNISYSISANLTSAYQWQVSTDNGANFNNLSNGGVYSGVTTNTLSISNVTLSMNNYQYRCIVSNSYGSVTSDVATLTTDSENPTITCVANQTVTADATNTYTVSDTEFNPTATNDNCGVASIINNFNSTSTLEGATLPEGTTTITWTVTDNAGNTATCSFNVLVNNYNGIADLSANGISIYPNPTSGKLTINNEQLTIKNIEITDITGKTILSFSNFQINQFSNYEIDLSDFENGIYIISIQTDKEVLTTKIIKE